MIKNTEDAVRQASKPVRWMLKCLLAATILFLAYFISACGNRGGEDGGGLAGTWEYSAGESFLSVESSGDIGISRTLGGPAIIVGTGSVSDGEISGSWEHTSADMRGIFTLTRTDDTRAHLHIVEQKDSGDVVQDEDLIKVE
jgi:hypothetical protein